MKLFLWGVANSAFQVEGQPQASDWREWTKIPGKIADGTNADRATSFFTDFEKDFQLAAELGATAFRISIAWERIEPYQGIWDLNSLHYYETIIQRMRSFQLEPIVTLQHFVLPDWLAKKGGLLAPEFVAEFADYAEKTVGCLSQAPASVQWWMTFNEPMVMVKEGYRDGTWPPGLKNSSLAVVAAAQLARAHIEAVRKIRALGNPQIKISIAKHWRAFEAVSKNFLNIGISKIMAWVFNWQFVNAIQTGRIFFWTLGCRLVCEKRSLPENRSTLDYLGINYYGRVRVSLICKPPFFHLADGDGEKSDLGWEIYPQGLYDCLHQASKTGLPLLIAENGLADSTDAKRDRFLKNHLQQLDRARKAGLKVFGYLYWSLTDNFEWAFGLTPKFGLVAIDYETGARQRRPSFYIYQKLIALYKKSAL